MLGDRLAERGGSSDEAPCPTARLVSLQPERPLAVAGLAEVVGLLPVAGLKGIDGTGEDAILFFAEGVDVAEIVRRHHLQLAREEGLDLIGDAYVSIGVLRPELIEQFAPLLHQGLRQVPETLQRVKVRRPLEIMDVLDAEEPGAHASEDTVVRQHGFCTLRQLRQGNTQPSRVETGERLQIALK